MTSTPYNQSYFLSLFKGQIFKKKNIKTYTGSQFYMIHISLSSKDWYKQGNSEALKRSTPGRCSKDLVHIYLDSEVTERKEKYLARGNDVG